MAAFYSPQDENRSTVSGFNDVPGSEPLTDNGLSVVQTGKPLNVKPKKEEKGMVVVPVTFSISEKEMLEKQAVECETALPKLIRIRCLMDESDIQEMQQLIDLQRQQVEELRVKLSFYQEREGAVETTKRTTDNPLNGLLIEMNEKQVKFLTEKYLESYDFESTTSSEGLPNGTMTSNHCEAMEAQEKVTQGTILLNIKYAMLIHFIGDIESRLKEHCGYDEEEFLDNPLIDEFDDLEETVKR
jgi:hypothetical protein